MQLIMTEGLWGVTKSVFLLSDTVVKSLLLGFNVFQQVTAVPSKPQGGSLEMTP